MWGQFSLDPEVSPQDSFYSIPSCHLTTVADGYLGIAILHGRQAHINLMTA